MEFDLGVVVQFGSWSLIWEMEFDLEVGVQFGSGSLIWEFNLGVGV